MGKAIKKARRNKKLTQKQLGEIIGKAESTIRKYENGGIEIPNSVLTEIGKALGVFFFKFTYDDNYSDKTVKKDTTYFLEQKLTQIGYRIGGDESEGYLWITYPDGTLEVTEDDLKELDDSSSSYLKFQLEELKEKKIKDFKKK